VAKDKKLNCGLSATCTSFEKTNFFLKNEDEKR
jgi:hypothetical protein